MISPAMILPIFRSLSIFGIDYIGIEVDDAGEGVMVTWEGLLVVVKALKRVYQLMFLAVLVWYQ